MEERMLDGKCEVLFPYILKSDFNREVYIYWNFLSSVWTAISFLLLLTMIEFEGEKIKRVSDREVVLVVQGEM